MDNFFEIGKIVNTQGVKGDVRVVPMTDDPSRFELLEFVYLYSKNGAVKTNIERVWYHKKFVIIKFENINDMTAAEKLRDTIIKITPEQALPLAEDEFYIRDLYDMEVYTVEGELLGIIKDIIVTGANDVYVVGAGPGDQNKKELLIPAIKQCIMDVDVSGKRMTVKLLEGLRD